MPSKDNIPKTEVGFVVNTQDYLLHLEGLPSARINDIAQSQNGTKSLITALETDLVEALILDQDKHCKPGDQFQLKKEGLILPAASEILGRIINPLAIPLDGKGEIIKKKKVLNLDFVATGIDSRELITEQLETGIALIDTLLPIGKGQRELIFGDPRSGKTSFILNVIANQKNKDTICIYTAIGKSDLDTKRLVKLLEESGGLEYTIVLSATSSEATPLIALAPTVAFFFAKQLKNQGRDVLLILDDMGLHAKYLREITLMSKQAPGRESYPGDIFYQHAHLFERAGNYNQKAGGGSITLLPVIETELENFTNLIPTNLMATTDGHLLFSTTLRAQGRYPAIKIERSVTRVGKQTQRLLQKKIAEKILSLLADYRELERYGHFGSELSTQTRLTIKRGIITQELLNQEPDEKIELPVQLSLLGLIFTPFFVDQDLNYVKKNRKKIVEVIKSDTSFKDIRDLDKFTTLEAFIDAIRKKLPVLENICQS